MLLHTTPSAPTGAVALGSLPAPALLSHLRITQLQPPAGPQSSTSQAAVVSCLPTAQPQPSAGAQGIASQLAGPAPPPLLPIVQSQPSSSLQSIQLQQATSGAEHGGGTALTTPAPAVPAGLFMGDSLAPLPTKIVKKIIALEYVEMADLLPEAWLLEESAVEAQLRRQKGPVTDILTWVQCYSVLVSTLSLQHPDKVPELMAYLSTITDKVPERLRWPLMGPV